MTQAAAGAIEDPTLALRAQGELRWMKNNTKQIREVFLYDRPVTITLSDAAIRAMADLAEPLLVEAELYFSCLIRKRLLFRPLSACREIDGEPAEINQQLLLSFRPVITQHCRIDELDGASPPLATMPVKDHQAFVPHWVRIDYRKGQWNGEFGYTD